jgi:ATP-dependent Clp protease, protease subunit
LYLKDRLNGIMAHHSKRDIETIKKDTDRDNYLSAKDAVEYGLIDKVVEKRSAV